MPARFIVLGAGVSGLTSALVLAEAGYEVQVWARELSPETTSDVAAATWYPLRSERESRSDAWLRHSFERFCAVAREPNSGVTLRSGIELLREQRDDGWWQELLPGFRHAAPDELPPGYADGYVADGIPVIEMPLYLPWLLRRLFALGASVERRAVRSLDEASAAADAVVNCTGLAARELVPDPSVYAVRGQVVRVAQFGLERYVLDEANPDGLLYIYPRSSDVVLGGTREPEIESRVPDPATAERIVDRCAALEPRVRDAQVLSHAVGLRPARPSVRLECEEREGGLVIHNYGHGGSGVTLSWGCAEDVLTLARQSVGTRR